MDTDAAAEYLREFAKGGTDLRECFDIAQRKATGNKDMTERVEMAGRALGWL